VNGKPDIWLVRHGATEWSASGRHTGRTDIPLTAEGQLKAAALDRALDRQRFAVVLASPLQRARETARLAGFADAVVDDDLQEWDYGDYEGLTSEQIQETDPGWTIFTGVVPGGETAEQVGVRAERILDRVSRSDGPVLLFAHGHFLRVLTATALQLGPRAGARFVLDPATISVIGAEHEVRTLLRWNEDVAPI
jgi:broad specificity phosphatase PhoE